MITNIRLGKRPSYPTDPNQNQWLQGLIWDTITTCWSGKPGKRPKLSAIYRVFLEYGQGDARNVGLGNLDSHEGENFTIAEKSQISKQIYSSVVESFPGSPLSSSFCEIRSQKLKGVSMRWTGLVLLPLPSNLKVNMSCSVSRMTLSRIASG